MKKNTASMEKWHRIPLSEKVKWVVCGGLILSVAGGLLFDKHNAIKNISQIYKNKNHIESTVVPEVKVDKALQKEMADFEREKIEDKKKIKWPLEEAGLDYVTKVSKASGAAFVEINVDGQTGFPRKSKLEGYDHHVGLRLAGSWEEINHSIKAIEEVIQQPVANMKLEPVADGRLVLRAQWIVTTIRKDWVL